MVDQLTKIFYTKPAAMSKMGDIILRMLGVFCTTAAL